MTDCTATARVSTEPTTAGSGTSTPCKRTLKGARYGRASSGSVKRSLITASCAAVKAASTPKLNRLARKAISSVRTEVPRRSAIEISAAETIACGETSVRRLSRPKARGSWPCSPSECASRVKPEIDVVTATSRMNAPVSPT